MLVVTRQVGGSLTVELIDVELGGSVQYVVEAGNWRIPRNIINLNVLLLFHFLNYLLNILHLLRLVDGLLLMGLFCFVL